jgi:hypothetical protein
VGRWSQSRRRGGEAASPPPPPALLTALDQGGGQIDLAFSGDVTANPAGLPDASAFLLDNSPPLLSAAVNLASNVIRVDQDSIPSSGMTATWDSQPPWILENIELSTSVLVS